VLHLPLLFASRKIKPDSEKFTLLEIISKIKIQRRCKKFYRKIPTRYTTIPLVELDNENFSEKVGVLFSRPRIIR
jgi:hypothetical protein